MHYNNTLRKNNTKITFVWIPSHVGILGNELADKLADQGSVNGNFVDINKLSVQEMYSVIENTITTVFRENIFKNYCHEKEFNYGGKAPTSLIQYSDNPLYDKIITKLQINCSNLGADNIKITPCPKCNAKAETFEHVVFECIHYSSLPGKH